MTVIGTPTISMILIIAMTFTITMTVIIISIASTIIVSITSAITVKSLSQTLSLVPFPSLLRLNYFYYYSSLTLTMLQVLFPLHYPTKSHQSQVPGPRPQAPKLPEAASGAQLHGPKSQRWTPAGLLLEGSGACWQLTGSQAGPQQYCRSL